MVNDCDQGRGRDFTIVVFKAGLIEVYEVHVHLIGAIGFLTNTMFDTYFRLWHSRMN